jgi:hypothetical protein
MKDLFIIYVKKDSRAGKQVLTREVGIGSSEQVVGHIVLTSLFTSAAVTVVKEENLD